MKHKWKIAIPIIIIVALIFAVPYFYRRHLINNIMELCKEIEGCNLTTEILNKKTNYQLNQILTGIKEGSLGFQNY